MSTIRYKKRSRLKKGNPTVEENIEAMSQPNSEFDSPWKKILDVYFEAFIAFCWPTQYLEIDWKKGYKMLDKELIKLSRNAPVTNRIIDKLVEVTLINGEEAFVLIHLEVQGDRTPDFEDRMFTYRYRLRDTYGKPIASLAILIDSNKQWRPSTYREEIWGSSIEMRFPIIKLIDYRDRIAELEASPNPFAVVILAQLAALEKQSFDAKLVSKTNLIKWLYRRGWEKEDVVTLLIFIDWVFPLPAPLEIKCQEVIEILEEEQHVEYVTSFERHGIQKGEGLMLLRLLLHKFKIVPDSYRQKVKEANAETLLIWGERVLDSQDIKDVFKA